jgi:hypothetical protein
MPRKFPRAEDLRIGQQTLWHTGVYIAPFTVSDISTFHHPALACWSVVMLASSRHVSNSSNSER